MGRTHANVARVTEVFLRREAQGRPLEPLRVAQAPFAAGDKWIATSFTGTGGRTPAGRLSVVLHAPLGLAPTAALGGLLIDAWTETVPAKVRDTAMALHFNNASTRAPQVVLLGVSPDPSRAWTVDTLVAVLRDTITFTRIRMQPSTTVQPGGPHAARLPGPAAGHVQDLVLRGRLTMETFPTWIRLHPASVDETLAISVQARIHDPLWLLGRQWQFGELRHDGGATPIDVRVEGTTAPLARMRGGGADVTTGRSAAIKPTGTPLEALVEREAVRETGLEQLRLRAEAGLHLLRMLRAASLPAARVAFWIAEGAFVLPADAVLDDEGREWWDMVEGRIPDGGRLPAAIRARLATGATPPIDPPEATVLRAWLSWAGDRFEQPASGPSTWSPEHMEYAFSVAGLGSSGEALLTAPEYTEGRLEWYHFEQLQASGTLGVTGQPTVHRAFRVPAPLDFAGHAQSRASGRSRTGPCNST